MGVAGNGEASAGEGGASGSAGVQGRGAGATIGGGGAAGTSGSTGAAGKVGTTGTGGISGGAGATGLGGAGIAGPGGGAGAGRGGGGVGGAGRAGAGGTTGGASGGAGRAGGGGSSDGGVKPDGGPAPTFTQVYNSILGVYCSGSNCHNPGSHGVGFSTQSGAYKSLLSVAVIPGNSQGSSLYTNVATGVMPMGKPMLSDALIEMVAAWIDAGALNN